MQQDDKLMRALLVELGKREAALQEGDTIIVQPGIDADGGMHVEFPLRVPGYDHLQIDAHLRLLVRSGLVESNVPDFPGIGIHFTRITPKGRRYMLTA
jgi:hypothetical protein